MLKKHIYILRFNNVKYIYLHQNHTHGYAHLKALLKLFVE